MEYSIAFGCLRHCSLDGIEGLGYDHTALIDEAIRLLDGMNLFRRETATVQAHRVNTAVRNGFAGRNDIGRDIFVDLRTALNHHMATDMTELMHQRTTSNDREVIHFHFAGQLRGIRHDDVVMQDAVVRYMAVGHDEVVITDDGLAFRRCAAMNSDELAQHAVIADDGPGLYQLPITNYQLPFAIYQLLRKNLVSESSYALRIERMSGFIRDDSSLETESE